MNSALLNSLKVKYTNIDNFNVLVITWNVGAKIEHKELLRKLIFSKRFNKDADSTSLPTSSQRTLPLSSSSSPEIIVFGLQEMVELSTSNVIGKLNGDK